MRQRLPEFYGWNRPIVDLMGELTRMAEFDSALFNRRQRDEVEWFRPKVDIQEREAGFLLSFDLPGLNTEDIRVEVENGRLTVSGERKQERGQESEQALYFERRFGKFSRSFTLPTSINSDAIEANFANGVLRLFVPKSEAKKTKTISITQEKSSLFDRLMGRDKSEGSH